MGISRENDPLYIEDFCFLPQECTSASTDFDKDKQDAWVMDQMEAGKNPEHFMRVWAHTHPGTSASPSSTDWETFDEAFGQTPWGVMLILGTSNQTTCVFRCGKEMRNIPVLIADPVPPESWVKELDNIEESSYELNWGRSGTTLKSKQEKRKRVEATATALTGKSSLFAAKSKVFTLTEIFESGPVACFDAIDDMMLHAEQKWEKDYIHEIAENLIRPIQNDTKLYKGFNAERYRRISPLCAYKYIMDNNLTLAEFKLKHPNARSHESLCISEGEIRLTAEHVGNVIEDLSGTDTNASEAAILDCICASKFYIKYGLSIDEAAAEFLDEFNQQAMIYNQSQEAEQELDTCLQIQDQSDSYDIQDSSLPLN